MNLSPRITTNNPSTLSALLEANFRRVVGTVSCGRVDIPGAGTFTVRHGLGERPDRFSFMPWSTGLSIAATEANQDRWGAEIIELSASGAGTITLWVERLNGEST